MYCPIKKILLGIILVHTFLVLTLGLGGKLNPGSGSWERNWPANCWLLKNIKFRFQLRPVKGIFTHYKAWGGNQNTIHYY